MNKGNTKRNAIIWTIFTIAYCFVTKIVDVGVAGETQTEVGCVSINEKFYEIFKTFNQAAYKISEILGYLMILICLIYAMIGLVQWIKRKNILKVDAEILCTGVLFAVTIGLYVLFNKVAITYRPIIVPGEDVLEASFPSSHSMLAVVVMGATSLLLKNYLRNNILEGENKQPQKIIVKAFSTEYARIIAIALAVAVPVLRFIAGVHWFTDILAGVFIACMLIEWYKVALCTFSTDAKTSRSTGGKHYK